MNFNRIAAVTSLAAIAVATVGGLSQLYANKTIVGEDGRSATIDRSFPNIKSVLVLHEAGQQDHRIEHVRDIEAVAAGFANKGHSPRFCQSDADMVCVERINVSHGFNKNGYATTTQDLQTGRAATVTAGLARTSLTLRDEMGFNTNFDRVKGADEAAQQFIDNGIEPVKVSHKLGNGIVRHSYRPAF